MVGYGHERHAYEVLVEDVIHLVHENGDALLIVEGLAEELRIDVHLVAF